MGELDWLLTDPHIRVDETGDLWFDNDARIGRYSAGQLKVYNDLIVDGNLIVQGQVINYTAPIPKRVYPISFSTIIGPLFDGVSYTATSNIYISTNDQSDGNFIATGEVSFSSCVDTFGLYLSLSGDGGSWDYKTSAIIPYIKNKEPVYGFSFGLSGLRSCSVSATICVNLGSRNPDSIPLRTLTMEVMEV